MLPASFMMAFKGIRSKLTETVNVSSSGVLLKLLDKEVIIGQERQVVKVPAQVFRNFCYVSLIFYIVLHAYWFTFVSVIAARVHNLFFVTTKLFNRCFLVNLAMNYMPLRMPVFVRHNAACGIVVSKGIRITKVYFSAVNRNRRRKIRKWKNC